jgi:hypothetical protein
VKKLLPYILILVISANLLAPVSVNFSNKKIDVNIQKAEAILAPGYGPKSLEIQTKLKGAVLTDKTKTAQTIIINATATWYGLTESGTNKTNELITYTVRSDGKEDKTLEAGFDYYGGKTADKGNLTSSTTLTIENFQGKPLGEYPEGTKFEVEVAIAQKLEPNWDYIQTAETGQNVYLVKTTEVTILSASKARELAAAQAAGLTGDSGLPKCAIVLGEGTFTGCLLQAFYFLVFEPTSYLFMLTGKFFDAMFAYSIADSSYRTAFVTQGWGLVRDICNVFFIFVLLYAAFSMILGLGHGGEAKKTVISVVIIGLLINFSLFTTQVIIDTSNILARVFYNSEKLKPKTAVVDPDNPKSSLNEISLSQGIVSKVNPQEIIRSNAINLKGSGSADDSVDLSNTSWFLLILMATAVNIVGLIVFASVGLFCLARVIGLWIAMVVVPFTFFSYTVPSMQDIGTVGWKKWWPETLGLAFLAPIFMFFMYLILLFLDKGFADVLDQQGGGGSMLRIIIPFVFIMIFMMKAKNFAKKLAGEVGAGVVKTAGTMAGLALGGAALAGRATLGRASALIGKQNWLNNLASGKRMDGSFIADGDRNIGTWAAQKLAIIGKKGTNAGAKGSFDFRQTGAGNAFSAGMGMDLNKYTNYLGVGTKQTAGGYAGAQEKRKEQEEKFAKTLGYDHHREEELESEISDAEDVLRDLRAAPRTEANRAAIARQEDEIKRLEKQKERNKTGREKEFHLYKRRQSGRLFRDMDQDAQGNDIRGSGEVSRDANGNIRRILTGTYSNRQAGRQLGLEAAEGFAKGAGIGIFAGVGGAIAGGIIGAIREVILRYNPNTNVTIGGHSDKMKIEDTYHPPAEEAAHHGGGDNHPPDGGGPHHP